MACHSHSTTVSVHAIRPAVRYGRGIIQWLDSDIFQNVVTGCIVLAVLLTTFGFTLWPEAESLEPEA